jgi:hypothetical protein
MELDLQSLFGLLCTAVPEIIDTVFAKTSPKRSFSMTEYERLGLVFTKMRVYKFGHCSIWLRPRNSSPSPRICTQIRGRYWSAKVDYSTTPCNPLEGDFCSYHCALDR